jgi:predicted amidohydrolase
LFFSVGPQGEQRGNSLVRVGALQFEPVHGDVDANLSLARDLLLADDDPRPAIVVFPEMALTGYIWASAADILPHAVKCSDPATHAEWIALAKDSGSWLVIGHPAVDTVTGLLYNRCTLVSPTAVVGHYDKTCLFVEDLSWATAGDSIPPLWDTPIGRVAPLICADLDYPEPIESAVARGAQAIVFSTAWVAEPAPSATWLLRAAEYGVPIIAADLIGTDRGVVFSGGSCIIDNDAVVVASNDYAVGLVSADIEMGPTQSPVNRGVRKHDINVHRLAVSEPGVAPSAVTISVWTGDPSTIPPAPPTTGECPHLIVLPTTGESRETWISHMLSYSSRQDAFVVQGRQLPEGGPAEILIAAPDSHFFAFTPSDNTPSAALLDISGVLVGVVPNSELSSNTVSRALSILGAAVIVGQGAHTLRPPRGSAKTHAPFLDGLGDADPTFGHPVRFRAGDANVWLGFCSESDSVPSGIFSPDHVAWPRNESLEVSEQWISQNCSVDPSDPWGRGARSKPLVSTRNLALYEDSSLPTVTTAQWLTSRPQDKSNPSN